MSKNSRHQAIIDIINEYDVSTQEELTDRLIKRGFDVSQATVSRDINELNLVKSEGVNKKYKYTKIERGEKDISPQIISLFKQITVSIESANNLIVVKTLSGNASAAGMAVDEMKFSQVIGTVAGDDTLLVVTKTNADAELIVKGLRTL